MIKPTTTTTTTTHSEIMHLPHCQITKLREQAKEKEAQLELLDLEKNSSSSSSSSNNSKKRKKPSKTRPPLVLRFGDVDFSSLKKAMEYCRAILQGEHGEQNLFTPQDRNFKILQSIFQRCDTYKTMKMVTIGTRMSGNGKGKSPSFYFTTEKGEMIPVPYRDCLRSNPTQIRIEPTYKTAFRNAIKNIIHKFHMDQLRKLTASSAIPPTSINSSDSTSTSTSTIRAKTWSKKNTEVEYLNLSFDEILNQFLHQEHLEDLQFPPNFFLSPNTAKASINDPLLKNKWISFHDQHMQLNVVYKEKKVALPPLPPLIKPTSITTVTTTEIKTQENSSSSSSATLSKTLTEQIHDLSKSFEIPVSMDSNRSNFVLRNLSNVGTR